MTINSLSAWIWTNLRSGPKRSSWSPTNPSPSCSTLVRANPDKSTEWETHWGQPWEELKGLHWWKAGSDLAVWVCRSKNQLYPGLQEKIWPGGQARRSWPSTLLWWDPTQSAVSSSRVQHRKDKDLLEQV